MKKIIKALESWEDLKNKHEQKIVETKTDFFKVINNVTNQRIADYFKGRLEFLENQKKCLGLEVNFFKEGRVAPIENEEEVNLLNPVVKTGIYQESDFEWFFNHYLNFQIEFVMNGILKNIDTAFPKNAVQELYISAEQQARKEILTILKITKEDVE